ncbi:hypothetical protein [Streptomyces sp. NPDC002209]|uniref:hypothetical protein n=1 Tax=Streptomyces sp. NPDC002209 TaxID=3364638 RepID=UPI0036764970
MALTDSGMAGVDPDDAEAMGILGRADYLRLLARGASPSPASQILFEFLEHLRAGITTAKAAAVAVPR